VCPKKLQRPASLTFLKPCPVMSAQNETIRSIRPPPRTVLTPGENKGLNTTAIVQKVPGSRWLHHWSLKPNIPRMRCCTTLWNVIVIIIVIHKFSFMIRRMYMLQHSAANKRSLFCRAEQKSRICKRGYFEKTMKTRLSKCHLFFLFRFLSCLYHWYCQ